MKTKFFFLFALISLVSFAGGGDPHNGQIRVRHLEMKYNLFYCSVEHEVTVPDIKGKDETHRIISNLAVYDISKQTTTYLFDDDMNENISAFFFESANDDKGYDIGFFIPNSRPKPVVLGILKSENRLPSDKMYIVTYNFSTENYTFWYADKTGNNLTKGCEFPRYADFYIDVNNRVFRFVKQVGVKIEIKDIKY
jgi:hypothetical protein